MVIPAAAVFIGVGFWLQKYNRLKRIKVNGKGSKRDVLLETGDILQLYIIDEGVDLFRLVSVDGHTGTLVHQQQIFVLVDNIQLWLEHREKEIFLIGLVKELIIDV